MPKTLYDQDFHLWIEQMIRRLQNREFESIDVEHLIKELTDLGKSDKNALESNLMVLLAYLLKLKVQHDAPYQMKGSWYNSIDEHRTRVIYQLSDAPSLKSYLETAIKKAYPRARKLAIKEGKRAVSGICVSRESEYPGDCPFSVEQILDEEFYGS